jgi:hypothetical protein
MDYNPVLIVLDSLTRLHTDDENAAGAMSKLYNDGIKPWLEKPARPACSS